MQRLVPAVFRASWPIWTRRTVAVVCTRRVLLVTMHFALCSLPWLAGSECSAFWPVWTRRTVMRFVLARLLLLVTMHLALCSLPAVPSLLGGHLLSWLVSLYGPSYLAVTCLLFSLVWQRLLWVELFVFSVMLGSTVALGDDFVAMVVFGAMLGSTVALGYDFLELFVFSAMLGSTLDIWCCQSTWSFHRCSSWTRLSCPDPEVHHSGGAAVAVPLKGRQHPRRCAETASHGPIFQRP